MVESLDIKGYITIFNVILSLYLIFSAGYFFITHLWEQIKGQMKKPEIPLNGMEHDAFTGWRHKLCYMANSTGLVKWCQRKYNKRVRAKVKQELENQC